jgi:hypothetical protein
MTTAKQDFEKRRMEVCHQIAKSHKADQAYLNGERIAFHSENSFMYGFYEGHAQGFADPLVQELVKAAKKVLERLEAGDEFIRCDPLDDAIQAYEQAIKGGEGEK